MKEGMVVAFHLEDGCVAVADVYHTGILARALAAPTELSSADDLQMRRASTCRSNVPLHITENTPSSTRFGLAAQKFLDALHIPGFRSGHARE